MYNKTMTAMLENSYRFIKNKVKCLYAERHLSFFLIPKERRKYFIPLRSCHDNLDTHEYMLKFLLSPYFFLQHAAITTQLSELSVHIFLMFII